jgi:hypothetical protein
MTFPAVSFFTGGGFFDIGYKQSGFAICWTKEPIVPHLDAAILAAIEREGCALDMARWHTCETTHCRAGWAIHLAGEAGYALEKVYGSENAGAIIYLRSRPGKPVPDFYASDEEAMADLRRCAAEDPLPNEVTDEGSSTML